MSAPTVSITVKLKAPRLRVGVLKLVARLPKRLGRRIFTADRLERFKGWLLRGFRYRIGAGKWRTFRRTAR